jgi:hypothetical protein
MDAMTALRETLERQRARIDAQIAAIADAEQALANLDRVYPVWRQLVGDMHRLGIQAPARASRTHAKASRPLTAANGAARVLDETATCPECSETFALTRRSGGRQKFCSPQCRVRRNSRLYRERQVAAARESEVLATAAAVEVEPPCARAYPRAGARARA